MYFKHVTAAGLLLLAPLFTSVGLAQRADIPTDFLPEDAFVAVYGEPNQVLLDPSLAMVPREVITVFGEGTIGIDPIQAESAMFFARAPEDLARAPLWGAVVRFKEPQSLEGDFVDQLTPEDLQGRSLLVYQGFESLPSLYLADDRTLFLGDPETIREMVASKMVDSPLIQLVRGASESSGQVRAWLSWEMIHPQFMQQVERMGPPPPPFSQTVDVAQVLKSVSLEASFGGSLDAKIELYTSNNAAAKETAKILQQWIELAQSVLVTQAQQSLGNNDDPTNLAMMAYFDRIGKEVADSMKPTVEDNKITVQVKDQISQSAVLIALLLPAVQSAREAARRAQSQNNMKQIAIAMHNYHDVNNTFPGQASTDDDGKPLLSWRVHLLPYLEQQNLYDQFHLDEPWDSEHNRKLIEKMPAVFSNPNAPSNSETTYLALASDDALMTGGEGRQIRDIRDGTSNTIMFVEANPDRMVVWTQPDDLNFDLQRPLSGLGNLRPGSFLAAFCDGSIRTLANTLDPEILRGLVTVDGEEIIDLR